MRVAWSNSYAWRTASSRSGSLVWELTSAAPVPVAATPEVASTPGGIGVPVDALEVTAFAVPGGMGPPPDVVMVGAGGGGGGGGVGERVMSEP
jgi:hypothetical protein